MHIYIYIYIYIYVQNRNSYVDKSVDEGHYRSDQHKALSMKQRIPRRRHLQSEGDIQIQEGETLRKMAIRNREIE